MTANPQTTSLTELSELLDAEREALLKGDLEKLDSLLSPKAALIDALNATPPGDADALQRLDGKVRRNQFLLDGALEGIRTVSARLAKLREVKGTLETYGADGKRHDIVPIAENSVERRA